MTHQRHIEDDFDEDDYVCKRCNEKEHSIGESESEEIEMSNDKNNANENNEHSFGESVDIEMSNDENNANETVFETVEVIAEYENNEINSNEAHSQIIELPVLDIEVFPISLTLGDESFSVPKSQKVKMTAARHMAINSSPDKLEQNNPCDEVGDNLDSVRDDSHLFQSDVDLEAIDTIASNHNWRKVVPIVEPNVDCQRNLIVHASGEDFEKKSSLKTFLEDISLGHLLAIFEEEDVSVDMIPHMSHEDLKQIGVKTFGQRFLIISAGNKLNLVAKEDTVEENTFHDTTNPVA